MVQHVNPSTLQPSDEAPQCDQDGCSEPATLAYRWDWGQTGVVCATHGALMQQTSQNLSRGVVVHPIQKAAPAPLTRDERVQLTARALVLEEEVKALQGVGQKLNAKNADLQLQLNSAIVSGRELKAQLGDAAVKLENMQKTEDDLRAENGRLLVELERLRGLETLLDEQTRVAARERVDG